jgi:hypothetical protein
MPTSPSLSPTPRADRASPTRARAARAALAACSLVALSAAAGCYPDQITDVEDLDTVTTLFDSTASFSTARTYSVIDSVVPIGGSADDQVPAALSHAVIDAIRTDMNAYGWVEEPNPQLNEPDVFITAGVTLTNYIYADWWAYWGYWPYWPTGWSAYGWYYPVPVVYSYEVGTLAVTMVDGRRAEPRLGVPIAWIAAVRGVGNGQASNQARAVDGVHQAFEQSPYLSLPVSPDRR